jgi:hypothetical protein
MFAVSVSTVRAQHVKNIPCHLSQIYLVAPGISFCAKRLAHFRNDTGPKEVRNWLENGRVTVGDLEQLRER